MLTSIVLSSAASGVSTRGPKYGLVAALLTRPSTRPNLSRARANRASTSAVLPVWHAAASARSAGSSAATLSRSSCLRDASTTRAPASTQARAIAAPMPRLAPVTTMVLPSRWIGWVMVVTTLPPWRHSPPASRVASGRRTGERRAAGPPVARSPSMRLRIAFRLLAITACTAADEEDGIDDAAGGKADGYGLTGGEARGVLRVANEVPRDELVDRATVASRAADGIATHRDGDRFDSLEELDAVPWVGPIAFEKLLAYARELGWVTEDETLLVG